MRPVNDYRSASAVNRMAPAHSRDWRRRLLIPRSESRLPHSHDRCPQRLPRGRSSVPLAGEYPAYLRMQDRPRSKPMIYQSPIEESIAAPHKPAGFPHWTGFWNYGTHYDRRWARSPSSWSRSPNSMVSLPRPFWLADRTAAPKSIGKFVLKAQRSRFTGFLPAPSGVEDLLHQALGFAHRQPFLHDGLGAATCCAVFSGSRRACPMSSLPAISIPGPPTTTARGAAGWSAGRERPTASAAWSWSGRIRRSGVASPGLPRGVEVLALDVLDERHASACSSAMARISTGTSARPACWAARQRRSPATIS